MEGQVCSFNWEPFKALYRRAHPFNLPAQPFNLSISDKLWTLEKNKGHFIIPEFNSSIIKWPLFFSKVHSLSDIDRLKGCAGRLKGCALRYWLQKKSMCTGIDILLIDTKWCNTICPHVKTPNKRQKRFCGFLDRVNRDPYPVLRVRLGGRGLPVAKISDL